MAPLIALGIKFLLPVLFEEAQKKLAEKENDDRGFSSTMKSDIPAHEAAPLALKAAVMSVTNSRTVWFSIALGILGVVEQNSSALSTVLGNKWGWVLVAVGGATAVLRTITTTSLLDKE